MDIFSYIPVIIGVRAKDFSPVFTTTKVEDDLENVHKRLLMKLHQQGYPCALVFQNELYLMRNLLDINNNEIKTFVTSNPNWDVLIMSPFSAESLEVPGFEYIRKVDNNSDFFFGEIYIASEKFMKKIKDNELWNINTYMYTQPFMQDLDSSHASNEYTIGRIIDIDHIKAGEIKYRWSDYLI